MGKFDISKYTIESAIQEICSGKYSAGDIVVADSYIMKDHGKYVQINIAAETPKQHISFDLFFDEHNNLTSWELHK